MFAAILSIKGCSFSINKLTTFSWSAFLRSLFSRSVLSRFAVSGLCFGDTPSEVFRSTYETFRHFSRNTQHLWEPWQSHYKISSHVACDLEKSQQEYNTRNTTTPTATPDFLKLQLISSYKQHDHSFTKHAKVTSIFVSRDISLRTGSQRGWEKNLASEWESERCDSASEASGMRGSL